MCYKRPQLLVGEELEQAMAILPSYDSNIRNLSEFERLVALNELSNIYVPSAMSFEIYSKLYFSYIRALEKKNTIDAIKQSNTNRFNLNNGILGGSDSFSIIGISGIGKSTAIGRAISIVEKQSYIEHNGNKVIPFLMVQTPCDSSLKGLLLEILRLVDVVLETRYYADATRARATLDMLIGIVSQVSLNHICVLIIDEAQNTVTSKNGKTLVNALVQLINNSGISLCFVGTPECNNFFESAFQLARRSVGLYYSELQYDKCFENLCQTVFSYQYTKMYMTLSKSVIEWLYRHSGGITAVVIGLIQAAQEIAILDGSECLNLDALNKAYKTRFGMLHGYLDTYKTSSKTASTILSDTINIESKGIEEVFTLRECIDKAKKDNVDALERLIEFVTIEEVQCDWT